MWAGVSLQWVCLLVGFVFPNVYVFFHTVALKQVYLSMVGVQPKPFAAGLDLGKAGSLNPRDRDLA